MKQCLLRGFLEFNKQGKNTSKILKASNYTEEVNLSHSYDLVFIFNSSLVLFWIELMLFIQNLPVNIQI